MSVRVAWSPSSHPDIASYNLEVSDDAGGPYTFLVNIPHDLLGVNYDTVSGTFFYVHGAGTLANWYRLTSVDSGDNESLPSAPMEPTSDTPVFTNTVSVNHDYGSPGALRYQLANGEPVVGALIRIYRKVDFDQGNTYSPLAVTETNSAGNWVNPVSLTTGYTYVVQFAKESFCGPDKVEIVV